MRQVQQQQLDKLAVLYEANKVRLFNFFLHMGCSRSASEDLVQDTFMRILAYRHGFSGQASFRSWMYGIARNAAVDHFRKNQRHDGHEDIADCDPAGSELTQDMELSQQQRVFKQALHALPAEDRDMILLSRFADLNYQEIAELMACNINTLKSRMQAALKHLQAQVQTLCEGVSQ